MNLIPDEQGFKHQISVFSGINLKIDDQSLNPSESPKAYNFNIEDGNLNTVPLPGQFLLPMENIPNSEIRQTETLPGGLSVQNIMLYTQHSSVTGEENFYVLAQTDYNEGSKSKIYYTKLTSPNNQEWVFLADSDHIHNSYVNYRLMGDDVIVIGNSKEFLKYWKGPGHALEILGEGTKDNPPKLGALTIHYERLWGVDMEIDKFRAWCSDDYDITNWDMALEAAGMIELIGQKGINVTILSAFDTVFVFQRHGIKRIMGTYPNEFVTNDVYATSSAIEPRTAVDCGDRILYMAKDGIYAFDGTQIAKISIKLDKLFRNISDASLSNAIFFKGKYYLSLCVEYDDEEEQPTKPNTIVTYDLTEGTFGLFRGITAYCFCVLKQHHMEKLVYGTDDGAIHQFNPEEASDIGPL